MTQFRSRVIRKTNYLFYSQSGNKILPWHVHGHLAEDGNLMEFVPPVTYNLWSVIQETEFPVMMNYFGVNFSLFLIIYSFTMNKQ